VEDLRKVHRLGKRGNDASPRPVLVHLESHITKKNILMESLYKIKSLPAKFANISIAHDMTKKRERSV